MISEEDDPPINLSQALPLQRFSALSSQPRNTKHWQGTWKVNAVTIPGKSDAPMDLRPKLYHFGAMEKHDL